MENKRKDPFRIWTGLKFGLGFTTGAYLSMYFMDGLSTAALMLFGIIMRGLGFEPGILG